jgi:hypothetical protein
MTRCNGFTKSGAPCKAHAAKDSTYCFRHAPPPASATPRIFDPRPFPPEDARRTEPGKAQPYAEIEDLLKVHHIHGKTLAVGVNGSTLDKVSIPQTKGSLKTTRGWLGALIKKTKTMDTCNKCCARGCGATADLVGAHVWFHDKDGVADLTRVYIVPACKNHNSSKFDQGKYEPFIVEAHTPCISMPPHVVYADFKKTTEL